MPVKNHATIDLVLEELDLENSEIFCLVNNSKELLVQHLKANFTRFKFLYQQEQLGLAHAIWSCKEELETQGYFGMVLPDNLLRPVQLDLFSVLKNKAVEQGAVAVVVVALVPPERTKHYGMVKLERGFDNAGFGTIEMMVEKPLSWQEAPLAIVGRYLFRSTSVFQELDQVDFGTSQEVSITSVVQALIDKGHKVIAYKTCAQFFDVGTPELWLETNLKFFDSFEQ